MRIRSAMMYLARRYKVLVDDSIIKRVIVREVGRVDKGEGKWIDDDVGGATKLGTKTV